MKYNQTRDIHATNKKTKISVAMAVYNGEKYIREQIDSILIQLREWDELIISDNMSNDKTYDIVYNYAQEDSRVKVFTCTDKGPTPNFENALRRCTGQLIFLSDQDDVWLPDKVFKVLECYETGNYDLIMHGKNVTDGSLNIRVYESTQNCRKSIWSVIKKMRYTGCCLAFDKKMLDYILPIPKVVAHDWWIALLACKYSRIVTIDEPLIMFRRHGANASSRTSRSLWYILKDRVIIMYYLIKRLISLKNVESE